MEFQGNYDNFRKHEKHLQNMEKNDSTERQPSEEPPSIGEETEALDIPPPMDDENHDEQKETQELVAQGKVKNSLYWKYFKASGSYFLLTVLLFSIIIAQILANGADYWIAYWYD